MAKRKGVNGEGVGDTVRPSRVNRELHTTERFPEVVGFCDRDDGSHRRDGEGESYDYVLAGAMVYRLTKTPSGWTVEEHDETDDLVRLSQGRTLGMTLFHALLPVDLKRRDRANLVFTVLPGKKDHALALLYYFGGCPGSFIADELAVAVAARTGSEEAATVTCGNVPCRYVPWLTRELVDVGVISEADVYLWDGGTGLVPFSVNGGRKDTEETAREQIVSALRRLLEEGGSHNFVIFEAVKTGGRSACYYVQFGASCGSAEIYGEAVSNNYLEPPFTLGRRQKAELARLGWNPPRGKHPNYYRHWQALNDRDLHEIAASAIATLKNVYGWPGDKFLEVKLHLDW